MAREPSTACLPHLFFFLVLLLLVLLILLVPLFLLLTLPLLILLAFFVLARFAAGIADPVADYRVIGYSFLTS
jgi:hypothetical protein